jgi:hypothetical protein
MGGSGGLTDADRAAYFARLEFERRAQQQHELRGGRGGGFRGRAGFRGRGRGGGAPGGDLGGGGAGGGGGGFLVERGGARGRG